MNKIEKKKFVLSCNHISKKFNELDILKDVSFSISKGEKIGLVGPNGSGKSTILKILSDEMKCDGGTITKSKALKIQYLPQVHINEENLSGGEIAKRIIAPLISSDADLFLLDEPTNNLDIEGLTYIEEFIIHSPKTFIIVSHDRKLLDKSVQKIIEIEPVTKKMYVYEGNYSSYIIQKNNRIEREWNIYSDKSEQVKKLTVSAEERLSWMKEIEKKRKNIKNLPIHEKEKPEAAMLRDKEAKAGRRARLMKDRLERFKEDTKEIEKPKHLLPLHIKFENDRGSTNVFSAKDITKKFNKKTIGPITFEIHYRERVHIVGKNGSGKTTILKILTGEIVADSGTIKKGENVIIGYLSQDTWKRSDINVRDHFLKTIDIEEGDARKILNRFRITAEDISKNIQTLSPGEYSRLIIAELIALKPNCIILDEPSNHLDLEALEELENGLKEYDGTLIVVSHDRYFTEKININKVVKIV